VDERKDEFAFSRINVYNLFQQKQSSDGGTRIQLPQERDPTGTTTKMVLP
jgi:hypothetical protein